MREKIIEYMRSQLSKERLCIEDFEKYDVPALEKSMEPFFWMVREHGTSLDYIGPTRMNKLFENEAARFQIFRESDSPIYSIKYWRDGRLFFFDGLQLVEISKPEVDVIYENIWHNEIERLKERYPLEYEMRDKPLELEMSDDTRKLYEETLAFAESIGDTSLKDCVCRLQHHARYAICHKINLYRDFADKSFGFSETIYGDSRLVGGIIYSSHLDNNRWSTHT